MHVDAILHLIDKDRVPGRLNLPDGILVVRNDLELALIKIENNINSNNYKISQKSATDYRYAITAPGTLYIKEADVSIALCETGVDDLPDFKEIGATIAFFDLERLIFPLSVRNPRPGDRFSPLGLNGTQKVKKYFIDRKIPLMQRKICPLLLSGGNIVWIAGHRIDNAVKLRPGTRRVLKAELLLA